MSEERKVTCPWCERNGIESEMTKQRESTGMVYGDDYYFCPRCHSQSLHVHTYDGNWEASEKALFNAATRRPPNRATAETSTEDLCALMNEGSAILESCVAETHRRTGEYCSVFIGSGDKPNLPLTAVAVLNHCKEPDNRPLYITEGATKGQWATAVDLIDGIPTDATDKELVAMIERVQSTRDRLYWFDKPTPADIDAARKERAHE